jgi:hypothetical protein
MGNRQTVGGWRYGDGIRRRLVWGIGCRKSFGKQAESRGVAIWGWNKKEVAFGNRVPEEIWETGRVWDRIRRRFVWGIGCWKRYGGIRQNNPGVK